MPELVQGTGELSAHDAGGSSDRREEETLLLVAHAAEDPPRRVHQCAGSLCPSGLEQSLVFHSIRHSDASLM